MIIKVIQRCLCFSEDTSAYRGYVSGYLWITLARAACTELFHRNGVDRLQHPVVGIPYPYNYDLSKSVLLNDSDILQSVIPGTTI